MKSRRAPHQSKRPSPPVPARPAVSPLRPQRKTFAVLMIVLAVWIAVLLGMYFTTVSPQRQPETSPAPAGGV